MNDYGDPELDRWIEERAAALARAAARSESREHALREYFIIAGVIIGCSTGAGLLLEWADREWVERTRAAQSAPMRQIGSIGDSSGNEIMRIVDSGTGETGRYKVEHLPPATLRLSPGESYADTIKLRDPVLSPVRFERGVRCVCQAVTPLDGVACETLLSADGTLEISLSPRQREFVEVAYVCVAPLAR